MCGASFYLKGEKIMLKKTIPYIDLNGVERKEDFYFHGRNKRPPLDNVRGWSSLYEV